jgi:hypothetical protein
MSDLRVHDGAIPAFTMGEIRQQNTAGGSALAGPPVMGVQGTSCESIIY